MGLNWFCETWFLSFHSELVLGPGRGLCFPANVSLGDKQQQTRNLTSGGVYIWILGARRPGYRVSDLRSERPTKDQSPNLVRCPQSSPSVHLFPSGRTFVLSSRNDQTAQPRRPSGKTTVRRLAGAHLNASRRRPIAYVHVAEGAEDVAFMSRYVLEETNKQTGSQTIIRF